jgi:predicted GIY-YIG superfamily endonuclease
MRYAYLLRSVPFPDEWYVGMTSDLRTRLRAHNEGDSIHTSKRRPWTLVVYVAFADEHRAQSSSRNT